MHLAENIIAVRKSLGLSQDDFANQVGISKRALQNYEAGDREPNLNVLIKIAVLGQVNLDWLLLNTGPRFRDKELDKVTQEILEKLEYLSFKQKLNFLIDINSSEISSSDRFNMKILKLLEGMDDEKRRDVLRYLEEKKLLNELLKERKKAGNESGT